MADPDKPAGDYMLGELIQEGINAVSLDPMLTATSVILVVIGDFRVSDVQNSGIGDSHPICIAGNVLEDLIDAFCRRT